MRVIDGEVIEFSWDGTPRMFRLAAAGALCSSISRVSLTSKGFEFNDGQGTRRVIPGLVLYRQILELEREVLEV